MGGCQNYGLFLDSDYNTAPNIQGAQKGTIILTTTPVYTHYIPCVCNLRLVLRDGGLKGFMWGSGFRIKGDFKVALGGGGL